MSAASRESAASAKGPGSRPGLRLRAKDGEDLAVISACLQDALVAVRDLAFDSDERTFILVANRLRWEDCSAGAQAETRTGDMFERTLCGLEFGEIDNVAYRGFRRGEVDRILSLLAIQPGAAAPDTAAGMTIDLEFAAGATIRMATASISCRVRDFGEPWPALWLPDHALEKAP